MNDFFLISFLGLTLRKLTATSKLGAITLRDNTSNIIVQTAYVRGPFKTCCPFKTCRHFKIAQQSLREEMRADPNPGVICVRASCKVSCSC